MKLRVAVPEGVPKTIGVSHIIQFPKPIHKLRKRTLKARRPIGFALLPLENAVWPAILELDQQIVARGGIANNQVRLEVAVQRILMSQDIGVDGSRNVLRDQ